MNMIHRRTGWWRTAEGYSEAVLPASWRGLFESRHIRLEAPGGCCQTTRETGALRRGECAQPSGALVPLRPGASARAVDPGYAPARCWRPLLATSSRYMQAPEARAMRRQVV